PVATAPGSVTALTHATISSIIERPLALQFCNRAVVNIDIHVVSGARNGVKTGSAVSGVAILFARELPEQVRLPCALRKVRHVSPESCIPQMRPGKNFVGAKFFGDRFGYFVVRINQRIAPELFLDSLDEDARVVKAHVLRRIFTFEIERNQVVSFGLNRLQKEVRLLNRSAGFAKVISAPFIAALLCFDLAFLIQTIDSVADGGAMDDRHHARAGRHRSQFRNSAEGRNAKARGYAPGWIRRGFVSAEGAEWIHRQIKLSNSYFAPSELNWFYAS